MARLTESLAGRAIILQLEGFAASEIVDQPESWLARWLQDPAHVPQQALSMPRTFAEQIWQGFLPDAQTLPLSLIPDYHRSYQTTYIERDVRLLANLADWSTLARFVRLLAALTGQEINRSQLGRELGITPQTATAWTNMLVATCQWYELDPGWAMR